MGTHTATRAQRCQPLSLSEFAVGLEQTRPKKASEAEQQNEPRPSSSSPSARPGTDGTRRRRRNPKLARFPLARSLSQLLALSISRSLNFLSARSALLSEGSMPPRTSQGTRYELRREAFCFTRRGKRVPRVTINYWTALLARRAVRMLPWVIEQNTTLPPARLFCAE